MKWLRDGLMVAALGLALGTLGCDAFSDRSEESEILSSMNLLPTGGSAEEAPAAPSESATVCKAVSGITVTTSGTQSIQSNSGWSTTGEVKASVVAADATNITISGDGATLSFVVQNRDDKTFVVCSVSYVLAKTVAKHAGETHASSADSAFTVTSGSLMVDQFNGKTGNGTKIVNAGSYLFVFKKEVEAAKAAALLLGAKAEVAGDRVTVEGTYYTQQLEASAQ